MLYGLGDCLEVLQRAVRVFKVLVQDNLVDGLLERFV
jgi:hypothetical protein